MAADQAGDSRATVDDRNATLKARLLILITLALAGCAHPVAEQATQGREDARLNVLANAMFYWRCTHQRVVTAGECRPWQEAYEHDHAAFIGKYGHLNP